MKLFTEAPVLKNTMTVEQYAQYFQETQVIAYETFSDYYAKIKDMLNGFAFSIYSPYNDKAVKDTLSRKNEVIQKVRTLDYTRTSMALTSKPNNFRGYYVDYLDELKDVSEYHNDHIFTILNKFKIMIANYINNTTPDKEGIVLGLSFFKETEQRLNKDKDRISKYFVNNGSTKASFRQLFKNYNDVPKLIDSVMLLDRTIYPESLDKVDKEVKSCRELIDTLISSAMNESTLNNQYKKDIVYCTNVAAQSVEFVYYLYSNAFTFYSVFNNNINDLLEI